MSHSMHINRLTQDELVYELKVRGLQEGTVEDMRKWLSKARRLERKGSSFTYPEYPYTFAEDRNAVDGKVTELEQEIADFDGVRGSGTALRVETKLAHVAGRADRMKATNADEKKEKSILLSKLMGLIADFDTKLDPDQDDSDDGDAQTSPNTDRPSRVNPTTVDPPPQTENAVPPALTVLQSSVSAAMPSTSTSGMPAHPTIRHSSMLPSPYTSKSVPVSKWQLKFSGEAKGMSVNAFLERVQELRVARHVTEDELFDSAVDLFQGKALLWYRDARKRVFSWPDLAKALRDEFQPVNYNEKLFEEIKQRTQGPNESIGVFFSVMSTMFGRLTCPISEEVQVKILLRNVLPFYQQQLALVDITTVEELRRLCRKLDARRQDAEAFVSPPRRNVLEPDLAYVETTEVLAPSSTPSPMVPTEVAAIRKEITCWNCNRAGHRSINCTAPKNIHCYRCGAKDVTTRTCVKCNSGNGQGAH